MKILGIVNVLNIIVSATLVYGLGPIPAVGVDGIVIGTVVARTSGGLLMIWVLFRGNSGLQLHRHEIHLKGLEVTRTKGGSTCRLPQRGLSCGREICCS